MKKLLHIGLQNEEVKNELKASLDRHFKTTHFNWELHKDNIEKLNQEVLKLYNKTKPEVVFMQIQAGGIIYPATAMKMVQKSIVVNWTGDVRHPLPEWYSEMGRIVNHTLFTNMDDAIACRLQGVNAGFLQVGYNNNVFRPEGVVAKNVPSIIFLASNYANTTFPLTQYRIQLVKGLKNAFGDNFKVYGMGWSSEGIDAGYLNPLDEAAAYRACKIAINLSHYDYTRYSSDRMLRLIGSGAFCLSHNFKGIEHDFVINKHCATFGSIEDCIEKCNYYLKNQYQRETIRKDGCTHVMQNFTWDTFMINLKKIIF